MIFLSYYPASSPLPSLPRHTANTTLPHLHFFHNAPHSTLTPPLSKPPPSHTSPKPYRSGTDATPPPHLSPLNYRNVLLRLIYPSPAFYSCI